jgi:hypothetical protein
MGLWNLQNLRGASRGRLQSANFGPSVGLARVRDLLQPSLARCSDLSYYLNSLAAMDAESHGEIEAEARQANH